jgi:hypothetical protein
LGSTNSNVSEALGFSAGSGKRKEKSSGAGGWSKAFCAISAAWLATIIGIFCVPAMAQEGAELRGTIINSVTQKPIPGVKIYAKATHAAYASETASDGSFFLWGMMPGVYRVSLQYSGLMFVRGHEQKGQPVPVFTLKEDEKIANLRFEMAPFATLTGQVKTETGKPLRARVEASPADGQEPLSWQDASAVDTDAKGMYLLHVAPGRYAIKAALIADPAHRETYWIESPQNQGATPIDALPGIERANLNLEFQMAPPRTLTGTVAGIPESRAPQK